MSINFEEIASAKLAAKIQKGLKERLIELINDENTIITSITYSNVDVTEPEREKLEIEYIVGDSIQT